MRLKEVQNLSYLSHARVPRGIDNPDGELLFLPFRSLRRESLLTHDGTSIFDRMLEDCRLVILQDADLRPEDLLKHRKSVQLADIAAIDMTRTLGLRGHFAYALLRKSDPGMQALKGIRLW